MVSTGSDADTPERVKQAGQDRARLRHHLGHVVADLKKNLAFAKVPPAYAKPGTVDVDRDLVRQGTEDRALDGEVLGAQPHVLRPPAQEGDGVQAAAEALTR